MNEFLLRDIGYVIRIDEIVWGSLLLALTLSIHGIGVYQVMRISAVLMPRMKKLHAHWGMGIMILHGRQAC